jgi:HlyD family secretion protein
MIYPVRSIFISTASSIALAALLSIAALPTSAADQPATATAPATQPTATEPEVATVKRGKLDLTIESTAVFEATDPFEARIHLRRYIGDLLVVHAIAPGQKVAKGDLLLQIDPTQLQNAITTAASELAVAKVNQTAAEAMVDLGRKSDELAMQEAKRSAQKAVDELAWFEKIGADQWKDTVELEAKIAASSKEAQSDELAELRKMYKSEELTNATADIVVKRALRNLEIATTNSKIKDETAAKVLKLEFDDYHERLRRDIPAHAQAVAELELRQRQAAVARDAAVTAAKIATTEAQTKLSQLQDDLQLLTVHSPIDGIAAYGEFANKVWYPLNPRQLNPGEKVAAGQILITVYQPGLMRARMQGPEANLLMVHPGIKVKLSPVALPGLNYEGTCGPAVPVAGSVAGAQSFDVLVALPPVDDNLIPGFKAQATARVTLNNVLLTPSSAITDGKVRIHRPDGSEQSVEVIAGRSNGKFTQILSGLTEGQQILTKGKP